MADTWSVTGFLAKAEEAAKEGLGAIVQAKAAEVVDRIERKADPIRETVRAATVAPVVGTQYREPTVVDTSEAPAWMMPAAIVAGLLVVALLLRKG